VCLKREDLVEEYEKNTEERREGHKGMKGIKEEKN
jgi:hypothetical protein